MTQDAPLHRACPQCGSSLGNDLPAGLCPRCLVREGLAILAAAGPDTTTALPVPAQGAPPAALFGDYELLGEIGRGGMGVVRHARQVSLNRMVALKMICSGGLATPAEVRRFRAEAEAAARLDHPNIVPIYDIGEQDGQHYFTMKLVEGGSLSEAIGGRPMPPRRAARLLARIARAVHFAHQHGILHRDLKPTNILLDSQDEPHLTDFGLAKFTERDSDLTRSAEVMGSASYMSPEQAAGQARQVTTATDVYSLGAVLYEALTGSPPFRGSSFVETLRQVAEAEPGSLRLLNPAIDRDLETLCRKCLEKDPRRRYASAELLALDLERWMAGETILARPCPPWDRTLKWVRRKPAVAALAALIPVVALAGLAGVLWQWRNARQTAEVLRRNLYAANINLAHRALAENNLGRAIALLDKCAPPPNGEDLRGFEWRYLRRLARGDELAVLPHNEFVETAAFSPDGRLLASVARDRTVHIWQTASRRALTNLFIPDAAVGRESSLVFSPDNRFLAACLNARKETTLLAVWNTATWACVAYWPEIRPPVFFLPDSSALVGRSTGGVVRWDTAAWRLNRDLAWPPSLRPRALSPDGRILLAEDRAQSLFQAWDIASARVLGSFPSVLPDDKIVAHAVSSGARWAATANWRGQVRLWSPAQKTEPALWTAHASPVYGLSFSPDGRLLATGGFDQVIHIWETATQQRLATLRGHLSEVWSVAFSPDGQWLASASKDATVRFWDPRPRPPEPVLTNASILLGWAEPGTRLAALKTNRSLAFWDLSTARETQAWPPPAGAASNATSRRALHRGPAHRLGNQERRRPRPRPGTGRLPRMAGPQHPGQLDQFLPRQPLGRHRQQLQRAAVAIP